MTSTQQINKKKAEEIASESRARNKFSGTLKIEAENQTPCFSGLIKELKEASVSYNPSYPLHRVPIRDAFSLTLEAVVEHELTHRMDLFQRGCPKEEHLDIDNVLTPISVVLKNKGFPNVPCGKQGHTLYTYFANLFEDYIDNTIVSDNRGSQGIFLLYDDMAYHHGEMGELFEGFLKLQAMTFPDKSGVSMLLPYFKQSERAKKAVRNFLTRTKLLDVPRPQRADYLSAPEKWKELSTVFAEEFSQLVDKKNLQGSYFPVFGGNDFASLDSEETQMGLVLKAYGKKGSEFSPPPFIEDNQALRFLYRKFAKQIDMKVNSYSVETKRIISHVGRRQFDFEKDPLERLKYGLSTSGEIQAQIGKHPVEVRSRYQVSAGNFPEVRVGLLDCSGSTKRPLKSGGKIMNPWASEKNQWTDTSIFHQELLCQFGLYELFRRRGTLKEANVRGGVFSDTTRMGKNLDESETIALQPEFGGTSFSEKSLDNLFKGKGSLVYTISDGEIGNWDEVKERFIQGAKQHHYFHLQIGEKTQMYEDLKEAGLMSILDDGKNSAKILIDITQREIYGG